LLFLLHGWGHCTLDGKLHCADDRGQEAKRRLTDRQ